MIVFRYQLLHIKVGKAQITKTLKVVRPDLERYMVIVRQIKSKVKERKDLLTEKKATLPFQILRHRELAQKITALTEDWEELRSEKAALLTSFDCVDDDDMKEVKGRVTEMETTLQTLNQQDEKYIAELSAALSEYAALAELIKGIDLTELITARQAIRSDKEREVSQWLQSAYEKGYDAKMLERSQADVATMLGEEQQWQSICQQIPQQQKQTSR